MTDKSKFSWELFHKSPIVAIIRGMQKDTILKIVKTYLEAGLYTLEITLNTKGATDIISSIRKKFPELNIGAGTVCTLEDLETALDAGAQFIVTPIVDEEVIKASKEKGIPIFPGAFSPTEIYNAWKFGASAVKVFPSSQLGVEYIRDVSAPLDNIKLLPTAGVSLENIKSFFEAGAFGVGMGNTLLNEELIKNNDFEGLKNYLIRFKEEIKDYIK